MSIKGESDRLSRQSMYCLLVWAVLMVTTLSSWLYAGSHGALSEGVMVMLIGLVALKVGLILAFFMEIASAPRWLQALCSVWLIVVFSAVSLCYAQPHWIASQKWLMPH